MDHPVPETRRGADAYPGSTVAAAVLATLFFPLVSLIAALVLLDRETSPARRDALRTWALASGAWIAVQLILAVALFAAVWSSSTKVDTTGPCVGGPDMGASAVIRDDGTAVFPCTISGSTTVTFP